MTDAEWICDLVAHGLVRPSFVPPAPIRRLRDLTRRRTILLAERTREKQRVEKLLEDAGVKLSVVATEIFGKSGRAILDALIAGSATDRSSPGWPWAAYARRSPRSPRPWSGISTTTTASWPA
jgi:transposase